MKKKLFFAAMLLAPSLAYSANPSGDLSVQVVPAASSPAVPAGAQAAGFTTLAANYDFTQPLPSNWLGCSPWDGQPHQWYQDPSGSNPPCDIRQTFDSVAGTTVLDIGWQPSYQASAYPYTVQQIYTHSPTIPIQIATDFPNAYYEATFRYQSTPNVSGGFLNNIPAGLQSWWSFPNQRPGQQLGWELDFLDSFMKYNGCFSGGVVNYTGGTTSQTTYAPNPCPNYTANQYHTVGMRVTGDGTSQAAFCSYFDGVQVGTCQTWPYQGDEAVQRHPLILWQGIACGPGGPIPDQSCVNTSITAVYNSGGKIAIQTAAAVNYAKCNLMNISGVGGIGAANGLHSACSKSGNTSDTDWILQDTSWPGGSYTVGGTVNPLTRTDMLVKSVRVWSCGMWQTTMCNGTPLTATP